MKEDKRLLVYYKEQQVGSLALTADRKAAFEYTDEWIEKGFSISPFSLPLKKQVFLPTKPYFGGLFGVFADSLPDVWVLSPTVRNIRCMQKPELRTWML